MWVTLLPYNHSFLYMSLISENSQILYKYFKAKIAMEKELNSIKSELYLNPAFNPYALWKQIDLLNRGKVGVEDIMIFLTNNGLDASLQEIEGVLQYFTKGIFIQMKTFIQGLVPKTLAFRDNPNGMCSICQILTKLIISIIDHNDELKTISKLTESMDESNFDFNFGVLTEFTPHHVIMLFNSFNDELDGLSFQIIFGNSKSINWQTIKQFFTWRPKMKQSYVLSDHCSKKLQFKRLTSFNSTILSDISTDHQNPNNISKIKFCTTIDVDIFDRETYLDH